MKNSVVKTCVSFLILAILSSVVVFADNFGNVGFEAYGLDTMAGYKTYLHTSKTTPHSSVIFDVRKPSGEIVNVSAVTNSGGVAQAEFSDYHTRTSGEYYISAKLEGSEFVGKTSAFTVYPGDVSLSSSTVSPSEQIVSSYGETARITVKLTDDYGNSVDEHLVRLVSSSANDVIELFSGSGLSDSNGNIEFLVSSDEAGVVTYTAYDVSADKTIDARAKVIYFDTADYIFANKAPNEYSYASIGSSSFVVDSFEFEDVPGSMTVGESVTFTLSAYDFQDQSVVDYTGTVRFSVIGDNAFYANLPGDYTFTAEDLGNHTFSLALSFLQNGNYQIEARDINNTSVYGEYEFVVGGTSPVPGGSNATTVIQNPVAGTYSNGIQVISGISMAGATLKIYDNNIEIGSVVSDFSGSFSFTTGSLADGSHSIYVARVNEVGTIIDASSPVGIVIDTSAADLAQVVIEPSGTVEPNSVVTVKIYTSDALSQGALLFEGNLYEFTENPQGYYEATFVAPAEFGQYPLSFVIVDQLGNESRIDDYAYLNVGVGNGVIQDGATGTPSGIGDVGGLTVSSADHRVTLNWVAPTVSVNPIKNYRVYYGLSPNQMTEAVDTFTNSTTWYIPNLKNGVEYYFAVVAVDDKGNVSEHFSNIVSATPNPAVADVVSPDVAMGTAGEDALAEMEKDVSDSGPDVRFLLLISLFGGIFYVQFSKRKWFLN